jgi:phosphoglycolate phosphatase
MNKIKCLIWDWNGTLFNDVNLCLEILNKLLAESNLKKLSIDEYKKEFGFPVKEFYKKIGFDFSKRSFDSISKDWFNEYEKRKNECDLQRNAITILKKVREYKILQTILSAYYQMSLEESVNKCVVNEYFGVIQGASNIDASSKLDNGRKLLERLKLIPEQVLFIGDTVHDYQLARDIGSNIILVANGHQDLDTLKKCCAEVYKDLEDIPFERYLISKVAEIK